MWNIYKKIQSADLSFEYNLQNKFSMSLSKSRDCGNILNSIQINT